MASFDFGTPNNNGLLIGLQQALEGGLKGYQGERARQDKLQEQELARALLKEKQENEAKKAAIDDALADEKVFVASNPQLQRGTREMVAEYLKNPEEAKKKGLIAYTYGDDPNPRSVYSPRAGFVDQETKEKGKNQRNEDRIKAAEEARMLRISSELRKEFGNLPSSKTAQTLATAFGAMRESAKDPSPAGDLSLVYQYMKLLDPGSTVREGEFAQAQNATNVPGQIRNQYNKLMKGERLSPEQRADFLSKAKGVFSAAINNQRKLESQYSARAAKAGLLKEDVITDYSGGLLDEGAEDPQITAAKEWLKNNPNDPDAPAVRKKLGL